MTITKDQDRSELEGVPAQSQPGSDGGCRPYVGPSVACRVRWVRNAGLMMHDDGGGMECTWCPRWRCEWMRESAGGGAQI